jgi:hypothetical protein
MEKGLTSLIVVTLMLDDLVISGYASVDVRTVISLIETPPFSLTERSKCTILRMEARNVFGLVYTEKVCVKSRRQVIDQTSAVSC